MEQIFQVVGAVLCLIGFAGVQLGRLDSKSVAYLAVNAVGAAILTVVALQGPDWGFLLLEGVWTIVAVIGLINLWRTRRTPATR